MIGNIAADFLTANIVWVHIKTDDEDANVTWAGKVLDVQPFGLMIKVLSTSVNGHITAYCERETSEVRLIPWQEVRYVTVREES
jgi:hypothetical protein